MEAGSALYGIIFISLGKGSGVEEQPVLQSATLPCPVRARPRSRVVTDAVMLTTHQGEHRCHMTFKHNAELVSALCLSGE